jgi:hypothetical protein
VICFKEKGNSVGINPMALEVPASERFCLHPFPLPLLRLKLLTPEKLLESGFQHFLNFSFPKTLKKVYITTTKGESL